MMSSLEGPLELDVIRTGGGSHRFRTGTTEQQREERVNAHSQLIELEERGKGRERECE